MQALKDPRREKFCQIVALEDIDLTTACFKAGYGQDKHDSPDHYHTLVAKRLMEREDVNLRINTIKALNGRGEIDYKDALIERLKAIIEFNPLKYYQSNNVKMANGRTLTDIYLAKPVQSWDYSDSRLVNGFDSRGMPKFIDKQWAFEKLLKIYKLDGSVSADVEDIVSLFARANLVTGNAFDNEPLGLDESNEDLMHQIEDEIGL